LLGQTVEMYGRDLTPPTDLAALLADVNEIGGIERIRFTTSNPFNFTSRLIHAIRDLPKVCEWVHLPLQSGSDRVLERMNRGYTRQRYLALIDDLRAAVPEVVLSTDLIVGFPGETEADFVQTLDMVERVGYDNVFVFRYSPRPGTPAADLADQIPLAVKAERNGRLLEAATRIAGARAHRLLGQAVEVLVDGRSRKDADELQGRTRCNRVVNFVGDDAVMVGDVVPIRITEVRPHSLRGTLAALPEETVCSSR
jgi:tRNA-2-methylthio-N6-dimethylallyladenosine synthase